VKTSDKDRRDSDEPEIAPKSNYSAEEQMRHEIRMELVAKFKSSLQKGTYRVKSPEIAEKIVQKIRDNKHAP